MPILAVINSFLSFELESLVSGSCYTLIIMVVYKKLAKVLTY
uniref:Uncharacterized protein n=1 Tax=Anguilla anguilla TaxID=7936 RepID=A0A0E9QVG1_ANGAN